MMQAIVLGSTGLLGRHVVQSFRDAGLRVMTPGRGNATGLDANICVDCRGESRVFVHAARREDTFRDAALLAYSGPLQYRASVHVLVSSSRVYRAAQHGLSCDPVDAGLLVADFPFLSHYARHKLMAEIACRAAGGDRVTVVRPCGFHGPGETKGVVFDLRNRAELRVAPDSRFRLLSARQVARRIVDLTLLPRRLPVYNIASSDEVTPQVLAQVLSPGLEFSAADFEKPHHVDLMPDSTGLPPLSALEDLHAH